MANDVTSFDAERSIRFDLNRGHVALLDGDRQILVPAAALAELLGEQALARRLGHTLGAGLMARVALRLRDASQSSVGEVLRAASLEAIVELLGGELAVLGLGSLYLERWGRALCFVLDPCTLDSRADEMLCGVVEGACNLVASGPVSALVVSRIADMARILVAKPATIAEVKLQVENGSSFVEILTMLAAANRSATNRRGDT